jgi:integrase
MLSLATKWEMRADNPVRGIERNPEHRRERFLSPDEIGRLNAALDAHPEKPSANAIRLLLLTGARRGEVLGATWDQFDLQTGIWVKPSSTTKQAKLHRVPLSTAALDLLNKMQAEARGPHLFPSTHGPLREVKKCWSSVCEAAGIEGVRLHDCRHSYASVLAGAGLSLPVIGALLGHSQVATTARYAHLADNPLRQATEVAGQIIAGAGQRPAKAALPARRRAAARA